PPTDSPAPSWPSMTAPPPNCSWTTTQPGSGPGSPTCSPRCSNTPPDTHPLTGQAPGAQLPRCLRAEPAARQEDRIRDIPPRPRPAELTILTAPVKMTTMPRAPLGVRLPADRTASAFSAPRTGTVRAGPPCTRSTARPGSTTQIPCGDAGNGPVLRQPGRARPAGRQGPCP